MRESTKFCGSYHTRCCQAPFLPPKMVVLSFSKEVALQFFSFFILFFEARCIRRLFGALPARRRGRWEARTHTLMAPLPLKIGEVAAKLVASVQSCLLFPVKAGNILSSRNFAQEGAAERAEGQCRRQRCRGVSWMSGQT